MCQHWTEADFFYVVLQLEDDLLYKLSAAEGDITEDVALIESLEESKRVATEITEKVIFVDVSFAESCRFSESILIYLHIFLPVDSANRYNPWVTQTPNKNWFTQIATNFCWLPGQFDTKFYYHICKNR